jgi:ADP-heptose:LPS heptosyltransferase
VLAENGGRPTLLILRALGLGDLLAAVPALRALADAYPHHRRMLAAPAGLAPLAGLTGVVDGVVDTEPLAPLDDTLGGVDVAVNLHGRGPQSHKVLLGADPGRLFCFSHPEVPESADGPPWRAGEHEVNRWCRLLEAYGIPADPGRLDLRQPPGPVPQGLCGATIIHPGAASAARRWPPDRWAAVARAEAEAGRSVIVTGGADEVNFARTVVREAGLEESAVYAGRTDLMGLATLVAAAGRVACSDTGVAHLATAYRRPSVVLFGPVSPALWGPPPRPQHVVLWHGDGTGDPWGTELDPALARVPVAEVTDALDGLLARVP